ncbi:disulfide bond formation protein B [Lysobacter sp. A3-1-A15]|uniref:disulfide bond formation protein B n=1 Tax=Novilysobacter viscosus TaxID=3098602 RepID=UPI002ED9C0F5
MTTATAARATFRSSFALGFLACAGLLAYAIYLQLHDGLEPCPLCIFQRIAFAALGVVFLLGALHAPKRRGGRGAYGVVAMLAGLVGTGIAGRHVWLQLNPPPIPSCGAGLEFMRETMSTTGVIRKVLTGSGDCGTVDWTFLGLSMPAWSLVWFVLLTLWAGYAAFRR